MLGDTGAKRRRRAASTGAPAWMATFADLSTLLLSFFVLLLSFSEMDVEKYKQIAGSLRAAFGVQREDFARDTPKGTSFVMREFAPGRPTPSPIRAIQQMTTNTPQRFLERRDNSLPIDSDERAPSSAALSASAAADNSVDDETERQARLNADRIRAILASEIERGLVEVEQVGTRIVIRIRERGSFPSGSAALIEPFTPVIRKIGEAIQVTRGDVLIAGHTDNVPISNARFRSNWELSAARAATLVHRLDQLSEVDPDRITLEGHADTEPLVPNDTVLNRARNRRVEVVLVHGGAVEARRSVDDFLDEPGDSGTPAGGSGDEG